MSISKVSLIGMFVYRFFMSNEVIFVSSVIFISFSLLACSSEFLNSVNCPSQETEETSTPTRPVENFVLTAKGLQERSTQLLDGTTVEK